MAVIKGRADVRVKHVSRLRRSGVLCVGYPTLPRRANLCAPTARFAMPLFWRCFDRWPLQRLSLARAIG